LPFSSRDPIKSSRESSSNGLMQVQVSKSSLVSPKVNIILNKSSPVILAEPLPSRLKPQVQGAMNNLNNLHNLNSANPLNNNKFLKPPMYKGNKLDVFNQSLLSNQQNLSSLNQSMNRSSFLKKEKIGSPLISSREHKKDTLEQLNNLYHAHVVMKENLKSPRKTEKLFLPQVKLDSSSVNNSQINSGSNNVSQLNYTTTTKRQSKSCTSSNLDSILQNVKNLENLHSQQQSKPKNIKSESVNKKQKENISISQLPEFMNNLINKSANAGQDPKHNNIINIVNNLDPNNDKKIAFKVNVNQYDIKYYAPSKSGSSDSYLTDQKTLSDVEIIDNTKESHVNNKMKFIELSKAAKVERKKGKSKSVKKLPEKKKLDKNENVENSEPAKVVLNQVSPHTPKFKKNENFGNTPLRETSLKKFQVIIDKNAVDGDEKITKNQNTEIKINALKNNIPTGHIKSNSINNPIDFQLLKPRRQTIKMHSMGITSNNILPKYTLAKNLTYTETKFSHNFFVPPQEEDESAREKKETTGGNQEKEKLTYDRGGTQYHDDVVHENTENSENSENSVTNQNEEEKSQENIENTENNENVSNMGNTPNCENLENQNNTNLHEITFLRQNSNINNLHSHNSSLSNNLSILQKLSEINNPYTSNSNTKTFLVNSGQKLTNRKSLKILKSLKSLKSLESLKSQASIKNLKHASSSINKLQRSPSMCQSQSDNEMPFTLNRKRSNQSEISDSILGSEVESNKYEKITKTPPSKPGSKNNTKSIIINKSSIVEELLLSQSQGSQDDLILQVFQRNRERDNANSSSRMGLKFHKETLNSLKKIRLTQKTIEQAVRKLSMGLEIKKKHLSILDETSFSPKINFIHPKPRGSCEIKLEESSIFFLRTISKFYTDKKSGCIAAHLAGTNPLEFTLYKINSKRTNDKENIQNLGLRLISKKINEKIKEKNFKLKKFRVLNFYKIGFTNSLNEILNSQEISYKSILEDPIIFNDHDKNLLFQYCNEFLKNKYLDLFKEFLYEISFFAENEKYSHPYPGKSVLDNFKLENTIKNKSIKFRNARHHTSLIKASDTNLVKVFGFQNHLFVNSYIMHDVISEFQQEELRDQDEEEEEKNNNTSQISRSKVRRRTPAYLKRKSDIQVISNIKEMRRSAFYFKLDRNENNNKSSRQSLIFSSQKRSIKKQSSAESSTDKDSPRKRRERAVSNIKKNFSSFVMNLNKNNSINSNVEPAQPEQETNLDLPSRILKNSYKKFALKKKTNWIPIQNIDRLKNLSILGNDEFMKYRQLEYIVEP
jgi:hypothetical protein